MRRLILLTAIPCLLGGARLHGQQVASSQPISLGSRIRIRYHRLGDTWSSNPHAIVGRLVAVTPDSVTVAAGADTEAVPLAYVTRLEEPVGRQTNGGSGAALGAVLGAIAGAVVGVATWHPCTETGLFACYMYPGQGAQMAAGAAGGAAAGALLGLMIGSAIQTDKWVPVDAHGVHLGLARGPCESTCGLGRSPWPALRGLCVGSDR
jgi:hypothetical protein